MKNKLKEIGYLKFDPKALTFGDKLFKPWWCILILDKDNDIDTYYKWFIFKRYGIKLQRPAFGTHISLIRGEPINEKIWKYYKNKYQNKSFKFNYEVSPRTNGKHWWMKVDCEEIENIREEMGYSRKGKFGLHLTLGMPTKYYLQQSYYIYDLIKKDLTY